ncbi:MAG: SRPBCC family protein [Ginsengibacter sp.]
MSIFRFIIFIVFVFIVIFLLALVLPSKVTVPKSVDINASHDSVKNQIINFENWKNWYPAFKDENIAIIRNPPSKYILSSVTLKNNKGKNIVLNMVDTSGSKIIVNVESGSSTKVNYLFILIPKENNQTQLTWDVNIDLGWYPWKRIEGILFDKFSGAQYQSALDNLRKAAEN